MKKLVLILGTAMLLFTGISTFTSCGDGSEKTNKEEQVEEVYACPMHHEITGKKGDNCSVCGMDLTSTKTASEHQGNNHKYYKNLKIINVENLDSIKIHDLFYEVYTRY